MTDAELKQLRDNYLPAEILKRKGQILYSGIDTLEFGRFYFLGLNPRTDDANVVLRDERLNRRKWSAYSQQCWRHENCDIGRCADFRLDRHQRHVQNIMCELGLKPEETFSTNFIFVESRNTRELMADPLFETCEESCWQMHRKLLGSVKPNFIVCLGNGKSNSAYSWVRAKTADASNERHGDEKVGRCTAFKSFVAKFELDERKLLEATVVGVLHPSRWQLPPGLLRFISEPGDGAVRGDSLQSSIRTGK